MINFGLRGSSIIAGIIIGLAIGSVVTYYVLTTFPILNEEFTPSIGSFDQFSNQKIEGVNESFVTNNLKYTILNVKKSDFGVNGEIPLEGGVFVITKIQIENLGKTEVIVYGTNWHVTDSEERIFKVITHNAVPESDDKKFSIRIPPGFKIVKDVGFEVPSNSDLPMGLYVANKPFESEPIFLGQIN